MDYVLVTGASSGLGREVAIALSEHYPIILNGRDIQRLNKTKSECKQEALVWDYDLSNTDTLETALSSWIKTNNITVFAFVHCAALAKIIPLRSVNVDIMAETFAVNVYSPVLITKVLASNRINRKALHSVVFISSNISNRGASAHSVYGSSKSALDGVMRNLAIELAPRIRVNSILPGGMITDGTKDIFENKSVKDQFERNYPLGIGTPSEITPAVEFLISDKSKWITGQQITIDGGRTTDITERSK